MNVQFIIPLHHQLTSNQQSVHSQSFAPRRTARYAQEYYESPAVDRSSGVTEYSGFSGAHRGYGASRYRWPMDSSIPNNEAPPPQKDRAIYLYARLRRSE